MDANEAARDIYLHGKHADLTSRSGAPLSLSQTANALKRTDIPAFAAFQQYYQEDSFANQFLLNLIAGADDRFSGSERHVAAVASCQALSSYIGILTAIHDASNECESDVGVVPSWDIMAALFIGSLEGPDNGGNPSNGYFLFDCC